MNLEKYAKPFTWNIQLNIPVSPIILYIIVLCCNREVHV